MTLESKARISRLITQLSFFGLLAFYTLRFLVLAPAPTAHPWVIWLIHLIPLIGFSPAVARGTPRPHAWLCFVLLLYFTGSVLTAIQPHLAIYGWIEALTITTLFSSAMLYARWQSQYLRQQHAG